MNKQVTLLFPGQGSQYVGMGMPQYSQVKEIFERADKTLDFPLTKLMFEGPEDQLKLTENTQPAIITHSVALLTILTQELKKLDITVNRCLGHSVGEYAALIAIGSLTFENALRLVRARGQFMQQAVPLGVGAMYALLKVPEEIVIKACREASSPGNEVMPANFNEPNQIVISGHKDATEKAVAWLKANFPQPHRAMELPVSAPFHSRLMRPAAVKMQETLFNVSLCPNEIAYIANIDANEYAPGTKAEQIKENLHRQIEGSVLWMQSIRSLPEETVCLEVGPGRVLAGLVKKTRPDLKTLSLDQEGAFQQLKGIFQ
ncbi:MAG: [acyl-carrier-protein] S-malonyltransferase [Bdellovibrionales bacterium GWA2_49_15]|nr:MAG: [acyl-carrier-protein] S-malonyltransferase [Bdellovibrionales bacterium GWA2_49_15]HAZ12094.1 [acyl-carrier-protein] S-malonyltransferase [Bdellovibrionales bacterium]